MLIKSKTIYAFPLEWLGENEIELNDPFRTGVLTITELNIKDSVVYGALLRGFKK